jgi:hypothetical protein
MYSIGTLCGLLGLARSKLARIVTNMTVQFRQSEGQIATSLIGLS